MLLLLLSVAVLACGVFASPPCLDAIVKVRVPPTRDNPLVLPCGRESWLQIEPAAGTQLSFNLSGIVELSALTITLKYESSVDVDMPDLQRVSHTINVMTSHEDAVLRSLHLPMLTYAGTIAIGSLADAPDASLQLGSISEVVIGGRAASSPLVVGRGIVVGGANALGQIQKVRFPFVRSICAHGCDRGEAIYVATSGQIGSVKFNGETSELGPEGVVLTIMGEVTLSTWSDQPLEEWPTIGRVCIFRVQTIRSLETSAALRITAPGPDSISKVVLSGQPDQPAYIADDIVVNAWPDLSRELVVVHYPAYIKATIGFSAREPIFTFGQQPATRTALSACNSAGVQVDGVCSCFLPKLSPDCRPVDDGPSFVEFPSQLAFSMYSSIAVPSLVPSTCLTVYPTIFRDVNLATWLMVNESTCSVIAMAGVYPPFAIDARDLPQMSWTLADDSLDPLVPTDPFTQLGIDYDLPESFGCTVGKLPNGQCIPKTNFIEACPSWQMSNDSNIPALNAGSSCLQRFVVERSPLSPTGPFTSSTQPTTVAPSSTPTKYRTGAPSVTTTLLPHTNDSSDQLVHYIIAGSCAGVVVFVVLAVIFVVRRRMRRRRLRYYQTLSFTHDNEDLFLNDTTEKICNPPPGNDAGAASEVNHMSTDTDNSSFDWAHHYAHRPHLADNSRSAPSPGLSATNPFQNDRQHLQPPLPPFTASSSPEDDSSLELRELRDGHDAAVFHAQMGLGLHDTARASTKAVGQHAVPYLLLDGQTFPCDQTGEQGSSMSPSTALRNALSCPDVTIETVQDNMPFTDVLEPFEDGACALELAVVANRPDLVDLLLSTLENTTRWNEACSIVMAKAVQWDLDDILLYCMEHPRLKLGLPDSHRRNVLHWACKCESPRSRAILFPAMAPVKRGATQLKYLSPLSMTEDGQTPLHLLVQSGASAKDVAAFLAYSGTAKELVLNSRDGEGYRPVDYAQMYGATTLLPLLNPVDGTAATSGDSSDSASSPASQPSPMSSSDH